MVAMNVMPALTGSDHIRGETSASLIVMTYGDYQCPRSKQAHYTIEKLRHSLGSQLCYIFRPFPQPQLYSQSQKAAETAEAAGNQGRFWQMHDKLFTHAPTLDDASLVEYASELQLDMLQFLHELGEHAHAPRITATVNHAQQHHIQQTPTFFINMRHQDSENLEILVQELANFI